MIKSTTELLDSLRTKLGDDISDESLALIEDVNDTMNDLKNKATKAEEFEQKYKDNDAEWRKKYRDRFFNTESTETEDDYRDEEDNKMRTFEDLFKEGK